MVGSIFAFCLDSAADFRRSPRLLVFRQRAQIKNNDGLLPMFNLLALHAAQNTHLRSGGDALNDAKSNARSRSPRPMPIAFIVYTKRNGKTRVQLLFFLNFYCLVFLLLLVL